MAHGELNTYKDSATDVRRRLVQMMTYGSTTNQMARRGSCSQPLPGISGATIRFTR